jgi:predicted short-subunit dehydrogenase-like oxidoreductase (DUF2520 family)
VSVPLVPFVNRIAVVGAGRVGRAMTRGLTRAGITVAGPLGRGAPAAGADLVLLAVPDREIAAAASLIPSDILVGHCSASTPLDVLAPHERFLLHPLASVSSADTSLHGAYAAVAGSTARSLEVAEALARALGLHPIRVAEGDRALYHASASLAANALVALLWDAERMAASTGLPRDALVPLATGALEGWRARGAAAALTGPVARGDDETVARQRDAVASRHPELLEMWDALTGRMRILADRGGST